MPSLKLPEYGRHIVFLGSTGSGKSELAVNMLAQYNSYLAIDSQDGLDDPKEVSIPVDGYTVKEPNNLGFYLRFFEKIRYAPKDNWKYKEAYDHVIKTFLDSSSRKKIKPKILYIDEIYHVGYGMSFPTWLPRGMTTARQRKLSFWIATQRPKMIPVPVLSEASKIYVFFLGRYEDIKYVSGFSRSNPALLQAALEQQQDDYSFIEIDVRKGTWEKFPPIKLPK